MCSWPTSFLFLNVSRLSELERRGDRQGANPLSGSRQFLCTESSFVGVPLAGENVEVAEINLPVSRGWVFLSFKFPRRLRSQKMRKPSPLCIPQRPVDWRCSEAPPTPTGDASYAVGVSWDLRPAADGCCWLTGLFPSSEKNKLQPFPMQLA